MAQSYVGQKRIRRMFGKIREVLEMPNLIEVQKSSYDLFLRSGDSDKPLDGEGLMGTFQSVFPIKDFNETAVLEFVKYELEKPKYDIDECQQRDMTYSASPSAAPNRSCRAAGIPRRHISALPARNRRIPARWIHGNP